MGSHGDAVLLGPLHRAQEHGGIARMETRRDIDRRRAGTHDLLVVAERVAPEAFAHIHVYVQVAPRSLAIASFNEPTRSIRPRTPR